MKVIPQNPDREIVQRSPQRMGGRFYVMPYEVHDKLAELELIDFYACVLRHAIIEEDWATNTIWVLGKFQSSVQQIARWRNKSRSHTRILLKKLKDASLIVTDDYTSYKLPMYKKQQDEGVRAADIHLLNKKVEELEALVRDSLGNVKMPIPKGDNIIVLSREKIISVFYKGIGQDRISGTKRDKARKVYKKLRADKFTREEITFAVQWTLENATEQPYDFALLLDTIGQAVAAKREADSREEDAAGRQKEIDTEREEREKEESESDEWEFYKAELSDEERQELRARAAKELADSGEYPDQFISDILIGIRETQILRSQFPEGVPLRAETGEDN